MFNNREKKERNKQTKSVYLLKERKKQTKKKNVKRKNVCLKTER